MRAKAMTLRTRMKMMAETRPKNQRTAKGASMKRMKQERRMKKAMAGSHTEAT
jgi:hypothetical protein